MLLNIPPELIALIASYLDRGDLYRLIISSSQLYILLQETLYRDVTLSVETNNRRIVNSFLYAVIRSPWLAGYVRSIKVPCWLVSTGYLREYSKMPPFDEPLVRRLVDETGYPERAKSRWLKDLEEDDLDAWVALLLPQLKELRKLTFSWPYGGFHIRDMLHGKSMHLKEQPLWPHLREVYISSSESWNGVPSNLLNPFFKLPSLQKLGCYAVEETPPIVSEETESDPMQRGYLNTTSLQPRSSNIVDIDLDASHTKWGMRDWIRACRQLRTFKITQGDTGRASTHLELLGLHRSLLLHQSTLERIWIDTPKNLRRIRFFGSFANFSALKFLHLPLSMLTRLNEEGMRVQKLHNFLPSSLETLRVFTDSRDFDVRPDIALLEELAASKKLSRLTAICCWVNMGPMTFGRPSTDQPLVASGVHSLEKTCLRNGISFCKDFFSEMGGRTIRATAQGRDWPWNEAYEVTGVPHVVFPLHYLARKTFRRRGIWIPLMNMTTTFKCWKRTFEGTAMDSPKNPKAIPMYTSAALEQD